MQAMSEDYSDIPALETRAMAAILDAVPFDGWSDAALQAAARDLPPGTITMLFPGGVADALRCWHNQLNAAMLQAYHALGVKPLRTTDKIHTLIILRFDAAAAHKEAVRAATAYYLLGTRLVQAQKYLFDLSDTIWRLAGDTSTDWNYYSKRLLLAEVYRATALFWLQDETQNHTATAAFCARQLTRALQVGGVLGKTLKKVAG
jgi:ubiquinone biosynthesis protein COQ9